MIVSKHYFVHLDADEGAQGVEAPRQRSAGVLEEALEPVEVQLVARLPAHRRRQPRRLPMYLHGTRNQALTLAD